MAVNEKLMIQMGQHILRGKVPTNFSGTTADVEDALRDQVKDLIGTRNKFMQNRYIFFEILTSTVEDVLPNDIRAIMGDFAETMQFGQGNRPQFHKRVGKQRAKQFLTQVSPAGTYETFRLDREFFDVRINAYGGAVTIEFERYLDGLETLMELYDILIEALTDKIYELVQEALLGAWNNSGRPQANKVTMTVFDADEMQEACMAVEPYGTPIIFAPPQFVAKMTNAIDFATNNPNVSTSDVDDIRNNGYIGVFRGYRIVRLPQSWTDQNNNHKQVNPRVAYIIPAGKEKIVKIMLEGELQVSDRQGVGDWSREIHFYKKMGVGIITPQNYWSIVQNTSIVDTDWAILA